MDERGRRGLGRRLPDRLIRTSGVVRRDKRRLHERRAHAVHTKHITPEPPINAETNQVNFLKTVFATAREI
jgi:hypothetical protein